MLKPLSSSEFFGQKQAGARAWGVLVVAFGAPKKNGSRSYLDLWGNGFFRMWVLIVEMERGNSAWNSENFCGSLKALSYFQL